jgi:hypothetical protein
MRKLKITYAMDSCNPREWDNLAKMVCFHKDYSLGDKHNYNRNDYSNWDELKQAIIEKENPIIIEPVYLYDHSRQTLALSPFSCKWDSGQVGFIYITKSNLEKFGVKKEKARKALEAELKTYSNYIEGNVFSYEIIEEKTCECCGQTQKELIDACSGFISDDWDELMDEMKSYVAPEDHYLFDERKRWVVDN